MQNSSFFPQSALFHSAMPCQTDINQHWLPKIASSDLSCFEPAFSSQESMGQVRTSSGPLGMDLAGNVSSAMPMAFFNNGVVFPLSQGFQVRLAAHTAILYINDLSESSRTMLPSTLRLHPPFMTSVRCAGTAVPVFSPCMDARSNRCNVSRICP